MPKIWVSKFNFAYFSKPIYADLTIFGKILIYSHNVLLTLYAINGNL